MALTTGLADLIFMARVRRLPLSRHVVVCVFIIVIMATIGEAEKAKIEAEVVAEVEAVAKQQSKKIVPRIVMTPPQPSDNNNDIWPAVKKALIIVGVTFAAKMALEVIAARLRERQFDESPEPMAMPTVLEVTLSEDDAKTSFKGIYLDAPPGAGSTSL